MTDGIRRIALIAAMVFGALPLPALAGPVPIGPEPFADFHQQLDAFAAAPCPFELPTDQEEGRQVTCGYLTVPEYHDDPGGRSLELLVVVYKSTADQPAAEPLVLLLGGPGQEVAGVLPAFSESSPINYLALLHRQDVIVLEQRGIGYSRPSLACPFDAVAGREPDQEAAALAEQPDSYADCARALRDDGVDLEAYDTGQSAADVDSLRLALGYDQVDLLGVSYGSKLALTVIRDFPEAVRSAVLASPLPLQANVLAGQVVSFDRALKRLFEACALNAECGEENPNLGMAFSAAVARLDESPAPMSLRNPLSGDPLELVMDGQSFIQTLYVATFVGLLLPFLPATIVASAEGDLAPLEFLAPFAAAFGEGVSYGANYVYNCNDELPFTDRDEVEALIAEADVLPELADGEFAGTFGTFEVCEVFDLEAPAGRDNRPVRSDVPTLILTGEYDPITPPAYGELAAETLPNSQLVVMPGLGHDPITTGGDCSMGITTSFLADPNASADTECVEDLGLTFLG